MIDFRIVTYMKSIGVGENKYGKYNGTITDVTTDADPT